MLQKLQKHIDENFPFLKGKKLLIAISGGVDSVVLTHLLHQLNFNIQLAHCNFQLRKQESDLDEEFVKELGKKLNLTTFTTKFNTEEYAKAYKTSIQVTARKLRYNWFQNLLEKHSLDFIVTAHHADDNLETFLINLTRGTGLEGLTGIPETLDNIVRPLLIFSRKEVANFAKKNSISWREDISNSEIKYLRNKIRHQIVPKLKEINPSLLESFQKTSSFLQESMQIIKDSTKKVSESLLSSEENYIKIDIQKTLQLSNPKAYLYQLLKNYHFTEWNDVESLLTAQSGKEIFSQTHRLIKDRNFLLLTKKEKSENNYFLIEKNQTEMLNPIKLKFTEVKTFSSERKKNSIFVDSDLLKFPLIVRKWQNGDYFFPSGLGGKKKLSKFFKDEKFSLLQKENIWLLCNNNNDIIWVINKRQDNRFVPNDKTQHYLKIFN